MQVGPNQSNVLLLHLLSWVLEIVSLKSTLWVGKIRTDEKQSLYHFQRQLKIKFIL